MLADRNIDEAELRQRLLARGIDVDRANPEELLRLRPQIEQVIAEMEAEAARELEAGPETVSEPTEQPMEEGNGDGAEEADENMQDGPTTSDLPESKIYGHRLFRNKSLQVFRATDNASPPDSYPLKAGDEIAVAIFGASQTDFILRLDDAGFVLLPNGLRIPLAGVSLGEARLLLGRRLRQYYTFRNGELSIRIQVARSVSVNIFGEVETSGSYSMSSLNTGFNALVASGGPTEQGSVRKIQLINGDEMKTLDVYEFLRSPLQKKDLYIADNASIFVPVAEKIVTVEGGVIRPMKYELIEGETLSDLIEFAGGIIPVAESGNIIVTRYVSGSVRVLNVNFEKTPGFALRNGDVINIPVIENPIQDFVEIEGEVLLPGRYAFEEGIDLNSLVTLGRLRPGARRDAAFLFRSNDDGTMRMRRVNLGGDAGAEKIILKRGDRLRILAQQAFVDNYVFKVEGAVRDSAVTLPFPQDGALSLEEAVLLAGGTLPNAAPEVMLVRTPLSNPDERSYERLDLRESADYVLQPNDKILVFGRERYTDGVRVSISGAVRNPSSFVYDPSLTVRDLIYLASGLRIDAAKDRVEVFRLQIADGTSTKTLLTTIDLDAGVPFRLQPFDEVIVRSAAEFETIQNVMVQGEVRYPGRYALLEDNEKLSDLLRRAGGLTEEAFPAGATLYRPATDIGYVVLDLDRVVRNASDPANMVVRSGDTLFIPKRQDLVTIYTRGTLADRYGKDSTTVDGTIQVAFQGDKPASWYVKRYAGGFEDDIARKRWTTVEYANGQVKETKSFAGIHDYPEVLPGSSIRVPLKPVKKQKQRREERFDWVGLTSVILGGVSTIVTFVLLSQRNDP